VRIITGKYKGRRLSTLNDGSVRPATDRVKGSIFNMLQNRLALGGASVLDLFAGSGSLGFEALSRGAAAVVFVDDAPDALELIEENAAMLGCVDQCQIIQADAVRYVSSAGEKFDLIFADPPYAYPGTPSIPEAVFARKLLKNGGFLIIEHSRKGSFPSSPLYTVSERREFGNTHVSFFISQPADAL
jgi:16S rRNA (guanine(966)-N(2))-methyltransferase RsmD